jgi:hypothetical protein
VISIPPPSTTVIESFGSTSLVQLGSNYFLDPVSGGTGVALKYNGSPVVAGSGQFSGWRPIGAEQTSTGYDVAWKNAATNQYSVWTTDSSGNFVSATGAISGTRTTLENYEPLLHQDLNGDGVIGVPPAPVKGATSSVGVSQAVSVNAANSETFVFEWGSSAGDIVPKLGMMEQEMWIAGNQPGMSLSDALNHLLQSQIHTLCRPIL